MGEIFRFIQSGDFLLGQPLSGFGQNIAPALVETLRDAPYRAVEQVMSTAVSQRVAFVVLLGDLWCRDAGPGPADFLRQQFQRLADRDIPIFWAAGRHHADDLWASTVKLPPNVHRFATAPTAPLIARHKKKPLAQITGQSWITGQNISEPTNLDQTLYTVVACCAPRVPNAWATSECPYWAVGGTEMRRTREVRGRIAHAAGIPQARRSQQIGPHGVTLVSVHGKQARLKPIATDSVRWARETLELPDNATVDTLRRLMLERMQQTRHQTAPPTLLVQWKIIAPGDLGAQLRHGGLDLECLEAHQADLAAEHLPIVPMSLEAGYREFRPEWLDEDSLLSEFLQVIRDYREQNQDLDLAPGLSRHEWAETRTQLDESLRSQVLRDAAALGIDLLTGDVDLNAFQAAWGEP